MFKKLIKNKKAQNTAEYAILISLVVAGIIAMQTYAQRALQARVRDAAVYLSNQTSNLGTSVQYEPYYLETSYVVSRDTLEYQTLTGNETVESADSQSNRNTGGYDVKTFDTSIAGITDGL